PALPARLGGLPLEPARVLAHLRAVGCSVDPSTIPLAVRPPSWRPDLTDPADLVEEVLRLEGYDAIPSVLPATRPGRGLTEDQRLHRRIGRALAAAGYVEVLCSPFLAPDVWDGLGADPDDPRRSTLRLANPLSEAEPALRTSLLPGLLAALRRNVGRGLPDVAVFETGLVYHPCPSAEPPPAVGVERRPSDAEVAALDSALPAQPRHLAVALCGNRDPGGWWGPGRPAAWSDALEAARRVAREFGVDVEVRAASLAPWHPGRCAALLVAGEVFGHAGEVHPRVVQTLGLPAGTCVAELSLEALARHRGGLARAPEISPFPAATLDVALVTDLTVAAGVVEAALRDGAGALLEDIQLFDVYTGAQVGPGRRSLAFALRLRAPDRTLTAEEAVAARDAAVAEAARRTGALLRGS
ncbi:MAG TPA: phenylalanine--tRNA ligase subunit beta, partial [Mycobacteriales bacterium]|nr:phenylalanine--tRNA ligase subunit beta [Mycobacteriales bacterium]